MISNSANYQSVYSDSGLLTLTVGEFFDLPIYYNASDPELSGLTLNIHYNSSVFDLLGYTSYAVVPISNIGVFADTQDLDSDPLTDKFVEFIWGTFNNSFPNISLPAKIADVRIKPLASSNVLSGNIRFTATETAIGYDFAKEDVAILVDSNAPATDTDTGTAGSITGNGPFNEGVTLTAGTISGDPDGNGTITAYQWFKDGNAITDATTSTYDVPADGAGTYKVAITYTDGQGFIATVDSADQVVSAISNGNGQQRQRNSWSHHIFQFRCL